MASCDFPCWLDPAGVCGISHPFGQLFPTIGYVTHALLSRLPLRPKSAFDLHVLGTPPAFALSQDQTLHHDFEFVPFRDCVLLQPQKESSATVLCTRTRVVLVCSHPCARFLVSRRFLARCFADLLCSTLLLFRYPSGNKKPDSPQMAGRDTSKQSTSSHLALP